MFREMMIGKIHRATVTDANLNYIGSISIDERLIEASNMVVGQKVDVLNINNAERFTTYIIKGEKGEICLNGAAARLVQKGDKIIIVAYAALSDEELKSYKPTIVMVDEQNNIIQMSEEI